MADMVRFERVGKSYGLRRAHPALRDVTLTLRQGEHVVILGPNGAGKSTFLRLLLGIARQTSGQILWPDGVRPPVGFAPERPRLLSRTTVQDMLRIATAGTNSNSKLSGCLTSLQLESLLKRRTEGLSKGEAQRVSLAFAFLTDAPLIVLDEPFEGLDPLIRPIARAYIMTSANDGRTLITTTHRLEEVGEPFGRVLVLNKGRIIHDMPVTDLQHAAGGSVLVLPLSATRADVISRLRERGMETMPPYVVRGFYNDQPALLAGPLDAQVTHDHEMHPLNLETLLQLWLQSSE
jgi:ABC-2 type transport system ATP-binding protein